MFGSIRNAFNNVTNLFSSFVPNEYTVEAGSIIRCNQQHIYDGYTHSRVNISFSLPSGTIVTASNGNRMQLEEDFVLPTATNLTLRTDQNCYVMTPCELVNEDGSYIGEPIPPRTLVYILIFGSRHTRFHFENSKLLRITEIHTPKETTYNVRNSEGHHCGRLGSNTLNISHTNNYAIISPERIEEEFTHSRSSTETTVNMSFDFRLTEDVTIKDPSRNNQIKVGEITTDTSNENTERNENTDRSEEERATSLLDTNIEQPIDSQSEEEEEVEKESSELQISEEQVQIQTQESNQGILEEVEDSDGNGRDGVDGVIQTEIDQSSDHGEQTQQLLREEQERQRLQQQLEEEKKKKRLEEEQEQQRLKKEEEKRKKTEQAKLRKEEQRKKKEEQEKRKKEEQKKRLEEEQRQKLLKEKQEREEQEKKRLQQQLEEEQRLEEEKQRRLEQEKQKVLQEQQLEQEKRKKEEEKQKRLEEEKIRKEEAKQKRLREEQERQSLQQQLEERLEKEKEQLLKEEEQQLEQRSREEAEFKRSQEKQEEENRLLQQLEEEQRIKEQQEQQQMEQQRLQNILEQQQQLIKKSLQIQDTLEEPVPSIVITEGDEKVDQSNINISHSSGQPQIAEQKEIQSSDQKEIQSPDKEDQKDKKDKEDKKDVYIDMSHSQKLILILLFVACVLLGIAITLMVYFRYTGKGSTKTLAKRNDGFI